ncbi:MAG TPA: hypothetical protein PKC97_14985 [Burkholderiaceae bacterium]|jgi:hypothetical protein|nr:hypothetical protein [Burkholderiaceae bacterium]
MFQRLAAQRLLALFVFGWLIFTFPLLGLWNVDASVFGIPLLPLAVFVAWALLIALVAWTVERSEGMD